MKSILDARTAILEDLKRRYKEGDKIVKPGAHGFSGSGEFPCPVCQAGTLRYSRASNGHVHAGCTTDTCVRWME
jgi:hypothetical protein